jgi:hypothetical protein
LAQVSHPNIAKKPSYEFTLNNYPGPLLCDGLLKIEGRDLYNNFKIKELSKFTFSCLGYKICVPMLTWNPRFGIATGTRGFIQT